MLTTLTVPLVGLLGTAAAETIYGAVVFTRHGDRTTKHYGAQALTSLGATQNFQVGGDYRARYITAGSPKRILGISEFNYVSSQVYATAPDQGILLNTATAFLQGLYPPLQGLDPAIASQTLNNGTNSTSPLNGYQYVALQGVNNNSPDTIWIKGDDSCPAYAEAAASFDDSAEFKTRLAETKSFYEGFYPDVQSVFDYKSPSDLSYAKAYDIFDLINVARIHNATSPARDVTDEQLFQLRTLADSAEFGSNYNRSQPARSIHAETFLGGVLAQLNKTVTSAGKLKLSVMAGSYDTFQAFFGLANLTNVNPDFFGLPAYASTMAFELFSDDDEAATAFPADPDAALRVRFLFKNGTEGAMSSFPLFGSGADSLAWPDFVGQTKTRAITSAAAWCGACGSKVDFCAAYNVAEPTSSDDKGGMSNAVAGVIGAVVTLGVVGLAGGVLFLLRRRRGGSAGKGFEEKGSLHGSDKGLV
ncbi:histidine phosphatase superfamily [Echria macrotheca]|uniref:Histidine phosphatase superfamily n=1 Tax=Echria macrotheca TaxID=438768 RepID=A0AAJ0BII9_9PEZI|nr:histidine phosphatase superfamily [Echria macrotheca]